MIRPVTARPPELVAVVFDTTDARALAEFYRQLLGSTYRPGDEPPPVGEPDPRGRDWLVLLDRSGRPQLAFQQVDELPAPTWPEPTVPQQLHLDLRVDTRDELLSHHARALSLGARLLEDRSSDPEEALIVDADPDGHPFCLLVGPDAAWPPGDGAEPPSG